MKRLWILPGLILITVAAQGQYLPYPGDRFDLLTALWVSSEVSSQGTGGGAGIGWGIQEGKSQPLGLQLGGGYRYSTSGNTVVPGGFGEIRMTWKPWVFSPGGGILSAGLRWEEGWIPGFRLGGEVDFRGSSRSYLFLRLDGVLSSRGVPAATLSLGLKVNNPHVSLVPRPDPKIILPDNPFSPDGDGAEDLLEIALETVRRDKILRWFLEISDPEGRKVKEWSGAGPHPETLIWDGTEGGSLVVDSASDYPVVFSVEDVTGSRQSAVRTLVTDILVIREGDRSRIRVPYIEFNPNTPELASLDRRKMEANQGILKRLAGFFQKYPDYRFRISGHGNLINWQVPARAEAENKTILKPLSLKRAESVRSALEALGISRSRMEVEGKGGDEPLAPFGDLKNNWKNRRVEFILLK